MDPALSQALSTLIGAIATAILLASAYYWGPGARDRRRDSDRDYSDREDETRHESRRHLAVDEDDEH